MRRRRAQALVETALVLPIFLFTLFGVIDFCRTVAIWTSITEGAREGAHIGMAAETTDAEIRAAVRSQAPLAGDLTDSEITITPSAPRSSGELLTVTIVYPIHPVTPLVESFLSNMPITISVSSSMEVS